MRYNKFIAVLAVLAFGIYANAQNSESYEVIEADLQAEVQSENNSNRQVVKEQAVPAATQQRVTILNQTPNTTTQNQAAVQQQPITNVEASPLTMSRAEQLRRARRDAELGTEQKIVEKIELSRLEDERRRAELLFGSKNLNNPQQQYQQGAPAPQAVQYVQAVPADNSQDLQQVKEDIVNSVRAELHKKEAEKPSKRYFSGSVGITEYSDLSLDYLDSRIATGFAMGMELDNGFMVEGSFLYSNFYISPSYWVTPLFEELDQYNFNVGVKYSPFVGMFRPNVGALVGYTYRKYEQRYAGYNNNAFGNERETDAFDMGFSVGLDVEVSKKFVIGAEYKYMTNLTTKEDSPFANNNFRFNRFSDNLEELDYYTMQVVGKFMF